MTHVRGLQRAAIAQDWLAAEAGSERVTVELGRLLPGAQIHTTFFDAAIFGHALRSDRVHTWPLQRLPGAASRFRAFLPLYPRYFEQLDLRAYDLVISSSSAFAKAVRTRPGANHIAYIHTPMRYAWDLEGYVAGSSMNPVSRAAARALRPWLQRWDLRTARRPSVLIANSATVRERIRQYWDRDAEVIHPPVQMDDIPVSTEDGGYLLVVSRLLAYRRLDLVVAAATRLRRDLIVAGDGPENVRLRSAAGPTVRFVGRVERATVVDLYRHCHAYVVPGEEDFGMAPVEAMAAGKPVVALRAGGALETVIDGTTGVHFDEQTPDALAEALGRLDKIAFDPVVIRRHAEGFSPEVFRRRFVDLFRRLNVDPSLYLPNASAR